mmetsp:Transcript_70724/g.167746  ORF Transcript_70724/g.167746 Transcript_70724/m.167746 type:complete len:312 (+) Transcript_70724:145-1080(+)
MPSSSSMSRAPPGICARTCATTCTAASTNWGSGARRRPTNSDATSRVRRRGATAGSWTRWKNAYAASRRMSKWAVWRTCRSAAGIPELTTASRWAGVPAQRFPSVHALSFLRARCCSSARKAPRVGRRAGRDRSASESASSPAARFPMTRNAGTRASPPPSCRRSTQRAAPPLSTTSRWNPGWPWVINDSAHSASTVISSGGAGRRRREMRVAPAPSVAKTSWRRGSGPRMRFASAQAAVRATSGEVERSARTTGRSAPLARILSRRDVSNVVSPAMFPIARMQCACMRALPPSMRWMRRGAAGSAASVHA